MENIGNLPCTTTFFQIISLIEKHMMNIFPKQVIPFPEIPDISRDQNWITLGSCFAQELSVELMAAGLNQNLPSPGNLYNPESILTFFTWIHSNSNIVQEIIHHDSQYKHPLFHSRWNQNSKEMLVSKLNDLRQAWRKSWNQTDNLVLTFGNFSAWYRGEKFYSNCHKIPTIEFTHKTLELNKQIEAWKVFFKNYGGELKNIFITLSPIRHYPKNPLRNSLEKAQLKVLIHALESIPNTTYLPFYEIINDQLRDYQFYKEDGIHLRKATIQALMECFWQHSPSTLQKYIFEFKKLQKFLQHQSTDTNMLNRQSLAIKEFEVKWQVLLGDRTTHQ